MAREADVKSLRVKESCSRRSSAHSAFRRISSRHDPINKRDKSDRRTKSTYSTREILGKAQRLGSKSSSKEDYTRLIESAKLTLVAVTVSSYKLEHKRKSIEGSLRLKRGPKDLLDEMSHRCDSFGRKLDELDSEYEDLRRLIWRLAKEKERMYGP
ncbi:hypothetical protein A0J61_06593 [Choanephora cucurbitarum]|uniref:Uncharacterized protein n=1 Tax=Choanephora cucurbitarum TaxID=101091 RepID=A0A1C7N9S1_9FUNG|nr:hypothetical protein A0J61_06593 [Choanephora cucurbitarum]